jgi:hypothetical protein
LVYCGPISLKGVMNQTLIASRHLIVALGLGLAAGAALAEAPPAPPATPAASASTPSAPAPAAGAASATPTAAAASPAQAAATPASEPPRDRRVLNGHVFLPSVVAAPIAVSSFALEVGFTAASATGPTYKLNGDPTGETRTYSWGGMGQAIRFQTVFFDQLAIRGGLVTSLASGIDSWSALVVGTSVQVGIGLGAEWSMPIGQSVRLGLSLDVESAPQLNLLVAAAIFNAIKTGGADPAGALEIGNALTALPALSVAWAPSPAFGLAARAGYLASQVDAGSYGTFSRQGVALGLSADADLDKLWKVPMGVGFTYAETIPTDGTPAGIRNLGLAVMYTGKKDVVVGATLGGRVLNIRPQYDVPLKSSSQYLDVVLKMYWP